MLRDFLVMIPFKLYIHEFKQVKVPIIQKNLRIYE